MGVSNLIPDLKIEEIFMNLFTPPQTVKMTLVGLNGNAFSLMGNFKHNAERQGWPKDNIYKVLDECKTGDYDNLIRVLMAHIDSSEIESEE